MTSPVFMQIMIVVIVIMILRGYSQSAEVAYVTSTVDGRRYLMQDRPDKQEAANLLARVVQKLERCVKYLNDNVDQYPDNRKAAIRRLKKFNPSVVSERTKDHQFTSYTVNKGESMVFCLRARDNQQQLHDENLLTFVALHELSHIATKGEGHIEEFNDNFRFVLGEAKKIGLYRYEDYRVNPKMYCGIMVNNPVI